MVISLLLRLLFFVPACLAAPAAKGTRYRVGVGKADVTGPVVEIGMMGYASAQQIGTGLRQRIYSRAFIVADEKTDERLVYVLGDLETGDTALRYGVLEQLRWKFGGLYGASNVALVGTHSHSGPGAYMNYFLPQLTTLGFEKQSYSAIVDGMVRSVERAHNNLQLGYLYGSETLVEGGAVQRSGYAYEQNPAEEKEKYRSSGGDVEKTMTALTFTKEDGTPIGQLNFFAVHGTSLRMNNTLISGDNKGLAALRMEKKLGNGFVAGFSQSSVADTSPNTQGAFCADTGLPCSYVNSTCPGDGTVTQCISRGPAWPKEDKYSCEIIAQKQIDAATKLLDPSTHTPISGSVRSLHTFVDFAAPYRFPLDDGTMVSTCPAAMGFSFAAGTTDGPGYFDFIQGAAGFPSNPLWAAIGWIPAPPNDTQIKCQGAKPILLNVGEAFFPYAWQANIIDFQLFRIGNFAIIVSSPEASTMAGRRWKAALRAELEKNGVWKKGEGFVALGGPSNTYSHYVTTREEYNVQRFEGASTMYGPYTLEAYIHLTRTYAPYLGDTLPSRQLPPGPDPPVNTNISLNLNGPVVQDTTPAGKKFGQVLTDVKATYVMGDLVNATFVGANPRNNLRLDQTFAAVEKKSSTGTWTRVRDDDEWNLIYRWKRSEGLYSGESVVTIEWTADETGTFRFKYYGDWKNILGPITAFEGQSGEFTVR